MSLVLFRSRFYRKNFTFEPALTQSVDVVFEADEDAEEECLYALAGEALRAQFPQFSDDTLPVTGWGGWCSVSVEGEIERVPDILDDMDPRAVDDIPAPKVGQRIRVTSSGSDGRSQRVTGYYRTFTPEPLDPAVPGYKVLIEFQEEREADLRRQNQIRIVACGREEAEFVSYVGIGGGIARLEDIEVLGFVEWDDRVLAREQQRAQQRIDNDPTPDYVMTMTA